MEASTDLTDWPDLTPTVTATDDVAIIVETGAKTNHSYRFYRVSRTSLATFDSNGFDYTPAAVIIRPSHPVAARRAAPRSR